MFEKTNINENEAGVAHFIKLYLIVEKLVGSFKTFVSGFEKDLFSCQKVKLNQSTITGIYWH